MPSDEEVRGTTEGTPPGAGTETPSEAPASRKQALVNTILLGLAIAAATILSRHFTPWFVGNGVVYTVCAVSGIVVGVFEFLFKEELKSRCVALMMHRATRVVVVLALIAEIPLAAALWHISSLPVIRIVPGPQLDAELGFDGQTLYVTLDDGTTFTHPRPAPRPFYVGRWHDRVRYVIGEEKKETRERLLRSILTTKYKIDKSIEKDDVDDVTGFLERWQFEPQLMHADGRSAERKLTATFAEAGNPSRPLQLTEWELGTSDGVPTYVADLIQ